MNRHLAHALGATALGALLLQPVTVMADPPAHARNENSAQYRGYSSSGDRRDDRSWQDRDDERRDEPRWHDRYDERRWDDRDWRGCPPRRGYVVQHLPPRYRVVHHHGAQYYYGGGAWYRPYGPRYVVVDPRARGYVVTDWPCRRW